MVERSSSRGGAEVAKFDAQDTVKPVKRSVNSKQKKWVSKSAVPRTVPWTSRTNFRWENENNGYQEIGGSHKI